MAYFLFDCAVGFIKLPSLCTPSFVESSVLKVDPIALRTNEGLNNYLLTLGKHNVSLQRPFIGCLFSVHTLKILLGVKTLGF